MEIFNRGFVHGGTLLLIQMFPQTLTLSEVVGPALNGTLAPEVK